MGKEDFRSTLRGIKENEGWKKELNQNLQNY